MPSVRPSVFLHSSLNKKTQAEPNTSAAHYRYINRRSATDYTESHNLPLEWKGAQRAINRHESQVRANGRISDKFTVIFPRGTRLEHAVQITRAFLLVAGQGRARSTFALQNFRDQRENPHAHVLFLDYDISIRAKVFGTSSRGSTDRLKDIWEAEANRVFEREGYDLRLDRKEWERLKLENARSEMHRDALTQQVEAEDEAVQESDEEIAMELARDIEPETPLEKAREALKSAEELRAVKDAREAAELLRDQLANAREAAYHWEKERQRREGALNIAEGRKRQAAEKLRANTRESGTLKGFSIFGWLSPGRRTAETAKSVHNQALVDSHDATNSHTDARNLRDELAGKAERYKEDLQKRVEENERVYGTGQEMRNAEQIYKADFEKQMAGLTAQQVYELYEMHELSEDDAIELLTSMGADEYVQRLDNTREI